MHVCELLEGECAAGMSQGQGQRKRWYLSEGMGGRVHVWGQAPGVVAPGGCRY